MITFERENFTEYGWKKLLDQLGMPEIDRWITKVNLEYPEVGSSIKLEFADSRFSTKEVQEIANRLHGEGTSVRYDSLFKGWYITYRNASSLYSDEALLKTKQFLDKKTA